MLPRLVLKNWAEAGGKVGGIAARARRIALEA
jgi:hypothetical protein